MAYVHDLSNPHYIFEGKYIVFTGFRNYQWEQFIKEERGTITNNINERTTLVIYDGGAICSNKYISAQNMGIKLISKSEFEKELLLSKF